MEDVGTKIASDHFTRINEFITLLRECNQYERVLSQTVVYDISNIPLLIQVKPDTYC